jgi:hypothetical protein
MERVDEFHESINRKYELNMKPRVKDVCRKAVTNPVVKVKDKIHIPLFTEPIEYSRGLNIIITNRRKFIEEVAKTIGRSSVASCVNGQSMNLKIPDPIFFDNYFYVLVSEGNNGLYVVGHWRKLVTFLLPSLLS